MRNEKLPADVARSIFGSKKCEKLSRSDRFWELRCGKSALWREAHFQVKMYNSHQLRTTFGS